MNLLGWFQDPGHLLVVLLPVLVLIGPALVVPLAVGERRLRR